MTTRHAVVGCGSRGAEHAQALAEAQRLTQSPAPCPRIRLIHWNPAEAKARIGGLADADSQVTLTEHAVEVGKILRKPGIPGGVLVAGHHCELRAKSIAEI